MESGVGFEKKKLDNCLILLYIPLLKLGRVLAEALFAFFTGEGLVPCHVVSVCVRFRFYIYFSFLFFSFFLSNL